MHRLYLEAFEPDVAAELCLGGDSKPAVKYEYYLNRFNTHHNLSFGRPRSDTCPTCDMIELKMKEESDASTKATLEAEKQLHLRKAERFYTSMQEHSALAARDPTVATLAFDFEQNLPVPVLPVGELFYARQLWLYNFGIHDCGTNTGTMYCWDETTSKRGSNEVASCLLHYINNSIADEVKTLYLYSDGCGGQNKNYTIIHFLHSLVKMERFELIMHVFPIRGHSFLPCDRDFGSIEMKKRKVETLYIPDQWIAIIEGARVKNKFDVVRVTQDMTFEFQKELAPFFKKVVKTGTAKLRVRDARVFRYDQAHDVSVKYSMSPLEEPLGFVLEKPRSVIVFPSVPAYNAKLPIRSAKLKDLLSLSAKYIPSRYKTFYDNLTSSTTAVDSDNED